MYDQSPTAPLPASASRARHKLRVHGLRVVDRERVATGQAATPLGHALRGDPRATLGLDVVRRADDLTTLLPVPRVDVPLRTLRLTLLPHGRELRGVEPRLPADAGTKPRVCPGCESTAAAILLVGRHVRLRQPFAPAGLFVLELLATRPFAVGLLFACDPILPLVAFFGDTPLADVTPGDADAFRIHLRTQRKPPLGENTTRRICGRAKQFFRAAVRLRLIEQNPFYEMKGCGVQGNPERFYFVTPDDAADGAGAGFSGARNLCLDWQQPKSSAGALPPHDRCRLREGHFGSATGARSQKRTRTAAHRGGQFRAPRAGAEEFTHPGALQRRTRPFNAP